VSRLCSRDTELGESVSERGLILRFLANENFPAAAVASLAAVGHDVVWVRIVAPGMPDPDVLAWTAREHRILLTFDKDFGELARGSALPRTCGVVLLRMPMPKPEEAGPRLAALITAREDWAGNFSVIEPGTAPDGIRGKLSFVGALWVPEVCQKRRHRPHHHGGRQLPNRLTVSGVPSQGDGEGESQRSNLDVLAL
jgi:Domain of unknown function (DUF5615)